MPKVILLSGVPGSGKSYFTKSLVSENSVVCSADHFFEQKGTYKFDPAKLGDAHGACLRKFAETLMASAEDPNYCDVLIVDNTNTSTLELAPYVALCQAYNIVPELVTVICDASTAYSRCTHGVPLGAIQRMSAAIKDRKLPPYWDVKETMK